MTDKDSSDKEIQEVGAALDDLLDKIKNSQTDPQEIIDSHLSELYDVPPVNGTLLTAKVYLHKWKIVAAASTIAAAFGVYALVDYSIDLKNEARVEALARGTLVIQEGLISRAEDLESSPLLSLITDEEKQTASNAISDVQESKRDSFFRTYLPEGIVENGITIDNYIGAQESLIFLSKKLEEIQKNLSHAEGVVNPQRLTKILRGKLDSLNTETSRLLERPTSLSETVRKTHKKGVVHLSNGNLLSANVIIGELDKLHTSAESLYTLLKQVEENYTSATEIPKNRAKSLAESTYQEALAAYQSADYDVMKKASDSLASINEKLHQRYKLRIIGFSTKVIRRVKYDFVELQAIDPQGRIVPRKITDFETGETKEVNAWGEYVARSTFEAIQAKRDSGETGWTHFGLKMEGRLDTSRAYTILGKRIILER